MGANASSTLTESSFEANVSGSKAEVTATTVKLEQGVAYILLGSGDVEIKGTNVKLLGTVTANGADVPYTP